MTIETNNDDVVDNNVYLTKYLEGILVLFIGKKEIKWERIRRFAKCHKIL